MYNFKKLIILILCFFILLIITGCHKKKYTINVIKEEDIMFQMEDEYYVYFYKDGYSYCDELYSTVNEYLNNPKELKLYVCELGYNSRINRVYEGDNGQGPNGKYNIDHVMYYYYLCIPGVPTLIKVSNNGYVDECLYVATGKVKIEEYLNNLNMLGINC